MIKALLTVRFRALIAGFMNQAQQKKKKSVGMVILFIFLYLYLAVVMCGAMCLLFSTLAEPYHEAGLDWLYFSMAGLMALGFSVIGSVFSTQSQLYDAKDNDLLLSMPIRPGAILLSRMIPLIVLNLIFAGIVMIPAAVMYAIMVEFSLMGLLAQLLSLAAVCLAAQAIACLLGWLLHLLLSRLNKSLASLLYLVCFLGIYFYVYSQAGDILNTISLSGPAIAVGLKAWAWPLYAMGEGCAGDLMYLLVWLVIACICFALVYYLLSVTFLHTATTRRGGKKRRVDLSSIKAGSSRSALMRKEMRKFLGSPVYLTNMGVGILLEAGLTVAGVILSGELLSQLGEFREMLEPYFPLIICAVIAYVNSTICISTPSISLEGKNIWILKSMPLTAKQILLGKLHFHWIMSVPVTALCALVLAIVYGCDLPGILLCVTVCSLVPVFGGILGLVCGLKWARLDWISEAYPVKQSAGVAVSMFSMMGVPLLFGGLFALTAAFLSPTVFLLLTALVLAAAVFGFYKLLLSWGTEKWNSL